jgi:hypothetical protein
VKEEEEGPNELVPEDELLLLNISFTVLAQPGFCCRSLLEDNLNEVDTWKKVGVIMVNNRGIRIRGELSRCVMF